MGDYRFGQEHIKQREELATTSYQRRLAQVKVYQSRTAYK